MTADTPHGGWRDIESAPHENDPDICLPWCLECGPMIYECQCGGSALWPLPAPPETENG